jgi:hypothetical protein
MGHCIVCSSRMCCCILLLFNGAEANYMGLLIKDISDKVKGPQGSSLAISVNKLVGGITTAMFLSISKAGKHLEACFLHLLEL